VVCVYLANTFLAYFIGVDELSRWVTQSPLNHPVPFAIMAFVTFAMMVDFCFFREQTCIIACPYGRLQSVLLDQNSLIVAYDQNRGETRSKLKKKGKAADALPVIGDCIDCGNCVTTCPTGIDIREGLQMECINCAQCIDACNLVMKKIGRAPDLIRYSSQSRDSGKLGTLLRARTLIYPTLIAGITIAFFSVFMATKSFDAIVVREVGIPHTITDDGRVRNNLKLKLTNRTDDEMKFSIDIESPEGAEVELREAEFMVSPRRNETFHISVIAPKDCFRTGRAESELTVSNEKDVSRSLNITLIGPYD
jgi:cytochrome c oxidase accessory protein FixG